MTDQHNATHERLQAPKKWNANTMPEDMVSCILELRARIEALELTLQAQTGSLTESEQTGLGVAPVSVLRDAAQCGADLAIRQLSRRPGDKTGPAVAVVNLNDDVSVRLTDRGRSVIPGADLIYMKTGADGWTKIQVHHLIRIFGPQIWSQQNVFERNEILIHS